jgi:hypothetical protein
MFDNGNKPTPTETGDVYLFTTGFRYTDFDMRNNVVTTTPNYKGYGDLVLAKYNSKGDLYWLKSAGGNKIDGTYLTNSAAIISSLFENSSTLIYDKGYLYVSGSFQGTANLNFGNVPQYFVGDSTNDKLTNFVAKYDTIGNLQWLKTIESPYADSTYSDSNNINSALVRILPDSSLLVQCASQYNSDTTTHRLGNVNFKEYIMATLHTQTGNVKQVIEKKVPLQHRNIKVETIDDLGNIYGIVRIGDSVNISINPATAQYVKKERNNPHNGLIVSKYNANKQLLWQGQFGNWSNNTFLLIQCIGVNYIDFDSNNNMYLTGFFRGKIDFKLDADTMMLNSSNGSYSDDGFIAKYTPQGVLQWVATQPIVKETRRPVFLSDGTILASGQGGPVDTTGMGGGVFIHRIDATSGSILGKYTIENMDLYSICNIDNNTLLMTGDVGYTFNGSDIDLDTNSVYPVNGAMSGCTSTLWATYKNWNVSTDPTPAPHTNVKVYPNPVRGNAHSTINVQFSDGWAGSATIAIYDAMGKKIMQQTTQATTTAINISGLAAGIYTLKVSGNNANTTQKLVVY